MKKLFALLALAAALTCAAQDLPTEIKLTNGFVMKDCTIVRWDADVITVKYAGGTVPVRLENIDPDQRELIEFRKEAALKQQRIADEKAAKALAEAKHKQEVQQKHEEKKQAEIDRKAAAIQAGLDQHRLVVGMSMDQVRGMYGPPLRTSSLTNVEASEWWIYPGLGREGNGAPTNLQIHFKAGLVTRWNNTQR
jgi:hypothetical protein